MKIERRHEVRLCILILLLVIIVFRGAADDLGKSGDQLKSIYGRPLSTSIVEYGEKVKVYGFVTTGGVVTSISYRLINNQVHYAHYSIEEPDPITEWEFKDLFSTVGINANWVISNKTNGKEATIIQMTRADGATLGVVMTKYKVTVTVQSPKWLSLKADFDGRR